MATILCKGCGTKKPLEEFSEYTTSAGNRSRRKTCKKCRGRQIYPHSRKKCLDKCKKKKKELKIKIIKLLGGKCEICKGKFNPVCFDFHHKDEGKKKWNMAILLQQYNNWDKIMEELENCILVCSNCHRVIHYGGD